MTVPDDRKRVVTVWGPGDKRGYHEPLLVKPKKTKYKKGLQLPEPELPSAELPALELPAPWMGKTTVRTLAVVALLGSALLGAAVVYFVVQVTSDSVAPSPAFPLGTMTRLNISGRGLWVYKPNSTEGQDALPAVFVLHGSLDNATHIAQVSRFSDVSEKAGRGFLLVYPEMVKEKAMSWDFGEPHEIDFFRNSVERLISMKLIRRDEVFVCGHSNGGTMALFLQNNLPGVFHGAAAVEAGVGHMQDWNNASFGSPTMLIWNHNDQVLREFGGEKLYNATLSTLRRHEKDHAKPASVTRIPRGGDGIRFAQKLLWRPTPSGQPPLMVISWGSEQPSHEWINPSNFNGTSLDAGELIWKFFQATNVLVDHHVMYRTPVVA
jgi:poly(3-hydroxybutyrate) depolymerase